MIKHMSKYLLAFILLLAACSWFGDGHVAQVNDEKISKNEYLASLRSTLSKYSENTIANKERLAQIKMDVLENMIKERILYEEALKAGIKIPSAEMERELTDFKSRYTDASFRKMLEIKGIEYDDWKESLERSLYIDELIKSNILAKTSVSADDIKNYYNNNPKEFTRGEEIHVRQIVLEDKASADKILESLADGANFAELAMKNSIAPEARKGGDLGWFERGIMPKAFDDACFKLNVGETSPIVRTEFGYHIFKLLEKRAPATMPFDKAKERIRSKLQRERTYGGFEKWYEGVRKNAKVAIEQQELSAIDPFKKEQK